MSKERKRSVGTAQLKMRLLQTYFNGAEGASPTPLGFDQFGITSITRLQTGQYTVIVRSPFERACRAFAQAFGTGLYCEIEAVAFDRVTFSIRQTSDDARVNGVADLWIYGSDSRYNVA